MPASIAAWNQQQWGVFVAVLAAGLLAVVGMALLRAAARQDAAVEPFLRHVGIVPMPIPYRTTELGAHLGATESWSPAAEVAAVGPGALAPVEPLVDDDVRAELDIVLGEALIAFRIGMEPAMRRARLWMLQGGETYAENALRTWRLMAGTGEYPMVTARATVGAA